MEHSAECIARQAELEKRQAEYRAKWPNFCETCNAEGGIGYDYDPSPAGLSLGSGHMTDYDPCPDCVEKGICPRYGKEVWTEEDWESGDPVICPGCGWYKENDPQSYPTGIGGMCECEARDLYDQLRDEASMVEQAIQNLNRVG